MVAELCSNRGLSEQAYGLYQHLTHLPERDNSQHRELILGAFVAQMPLSIFLSDSPTGGFARPHVLRDAALRTFHGDEEACAQIQIAYAKCIYIDPDRGESASGAEELSRQALVMQEIGKKTHLPEGLQKAALQLAGALGA